MTAYVISEKQLNETLGAISAAGILLGTTPDGVIATTHKMLEGVRTNTLTSALKEERERVLNDILSKREELKRSVRLTERSDWYDLWSYEGDMIESMRGEPWPTILVTARRVNTTRSKIMWRWANG
jgi:hypothetical protein